MAGHKDGATGQSKIFPCRAQSISTTDLVLEAPVRGDTGEGIFIKLDDLGLFHGRVERHTLQGFTVAIVASEAERRHLAAKLGWMKQRQVSNTPDHRENKRRLPRNRHCVVVLLDGTRADAFIIDMSCSGVAVSAAIRPKLGAPVAVGKLLGRVVRYRDDGFAVHFLDRQDDADLEGHLTSLSSNSHDELVDQLRAYARTLVGA
ncbi:PilZ domain-containing protein [Devosia sp. PTR5]|uniref:PilZ domain-containing protein n=1 Tax=Devosia oryzisoli TaxID=2774138 RepID=A0A927FXG5_9HYPH|nr:PilZ domain-containing protein [Devosia oryzisoli]MBD8066598.1 PilZ domain-containing protein [Devosia oryzisoli]